MNLFKFKLINYKTILVDMIDNLYPKPIAIYDNIIVQKNLFSYNMCIYKIVYF